MAHSGRALQGHEWARKNHMDDSNSSVFRAIYLERFFYNNLQKRSFILRSNTATKQPPYLSELCRQIRNIEGRRQLRSTTRGDLDVPRCRLSTYGRRAFCAGPAAWNSLPDRLKNSTLTIEQFCYLAAPYRASMR